jgi:hypothetical protein
MGGGTLAASSQPHTEFAEVLHSGRLLGTTINYKVTPTHTIEDLFLSRSVGDASGRLRGRPFRHDPTPVSTALDGRDNDGDAHEAKTGADQDSAHQGR